MNGIPKGLCSFGGVTPHKMGRCREATEGTYLLGQRQRLLWGDSPQCGEMSQSDRGAGAVSLGQSPTVTKAFPKRDVEDTVPYIFSTGG